MKGKIFALVLALAITPVLTGCSPEMDKDAGTDGSTTTQSDTARTRRSTSTAARGKYFADQNGDVRDDRTDWIGDDVRRAADSMMDRAKNAGDKMGRSIRDMNR